MFLLEYFLFPKGSLPNLSKLFQADELLTHWGQLTPICVVKQTIIGSDNGLSPERRQAIIWTNAGILLIGPLGTNFSEILIEIQTISLKKILLKMSSAKCWPFCLGLNVLRDENINCCEEFLCGVLMNILFKPIPSSLSNNFTDWWTSASN